MRWTILPKPNQEIVEALAHSLKVDYSIASLLVQRGISNFEQAKGFFRPELTDLHDPFLMKDMDKAVERIQVAFQNKEKILVFGDYDVDGTTSVALMFSYLKKRHNEVDTYIPDRYTEGYGISFAGIDYASSTGCKLIIALDCGIKSIEHVAYARSLGIDFIICDHHLPGASLPDAVAILDPKRIDCSYPYDELCGCGVGFKLVQALAGLAGQSAEHLLPFLDLVATAIAADMVPITGENRVLAYFGMQVLNSAPRPGLRALLGESKKARISITDVVFTVAPRINAAGRIKHGKEAVLLLAESDLEEALKFSKQIELYNASRKDIDKSITEDALAQIEASGEQDRFTTVVYNESWHKGVIGIVASRLTETYYRPTIVFTKSNNKLTASARSVVGFDLYQALEACSDYLEQFGGHRYAAGLTIKTEHFTAFKAAFEQHVAQTINPDLLVPEISIDSEIELNSITPKFRRLISQFEPFGPGNMAPVFLTRNVADTGYGKTIGADDSHLKLYLKQEGVSLPAVGFNLGSKIKFTKLRRALDVVYVVEENEWNGNVQLQLLLKDVRPSNPIIV
jgi:single-stranded-DNA-specific exonuclease